MFLHFAKRKILALSLILFSHSTLCGFSSTGRSSMGINIRAKNAFKPNRCYWMAKKYIHKSKWKMWKTARIADLRFSDSIHCAICFGRERTQFIIVNLPVDAVIYKVNLKMCKKVGDFKIVSFHYLLSVFFFPVKNVKCELKYWSWFKCSQRFQWIKVDLLHGKNVDREKSWNFLFDRTFLFHGFYIQKMQYKSAFFDLRWIKKKEHFIIKNRIEMVRIATPLYFLYA